MKHKTRVVLNATILALTLFTADLTNEMGLTITSGIIQMMCTFGALIFVFKYMINIEKIMTSLGIRFYHRYELDDIRSEIISLKQSNIKKAKGKK
jgi:hypothetical protein